LLVCPSRHTIRDRQVGDDPPLPHRISYLIAELRIPLSPRCQVIIGGQPVTLLAVASAVGKDKVMAQVNWVTRPCDEVINVNAGW
jgi:hypothetical protein